MIALLLDTSTERAFLALVQDGVIRSEKLLPIGYNHSKDIMVNVAHLFEDSGFCKNDLDFIGVAAGPGSYTGIRVGVTVAKTLSFALKKPLVGVSTLEGYESKDEGAFAVLVDAKISGLYAIKASSKDGDIRYLCNHSVQPWDSIAQYLDGINNVLTPNSKRIAAVMSKKHPDLKVSWKEVYPDSLRFYNRAFELYQQGKYSLDGSLEIYYLRRTQAEIEGDVLN